MHNAHELGGIHDSQMEMNGLKQETRRFGIYHGRMIISKLVKSLPVSSMGGQMVCRIWNMMSLKC